MKTFAVLASLAATALAQNVFVNLPNGNQLPAGSDVTVQVTRPNSLTGSEEMAVAIGLQSCPTSPCLSADSVLGQVVLYNGPFDPQYHGTTGGGMPYQNFTVTIPENTAQGQGLIGVAHSALVGAANWPFLEVLNATVTIV